MRKPDEFYKTERNIITQWSFDNLEESNKALAEFKRLYPTSTFYKDNFPNLGKYWISIVTPLHLS